MSQTQEWQRERIGNEVEKRTEEHQALQVTREQNGGCCDSYEMQKFNIHA